MDMWAGIAVGIVATHLFWTVAFGIIWKRNEHAEKSAANWISSAYDPDVQIRFVGGRIESRLRQR